jgi:2-polyprenyl-3-methyl-5-hydroxy-6-metoxy-1,4-benzoquinol methylase
MIFNKRVNYFPVLSSLVDPIENKTILDFGGNRGNLIYFSQGKILQSNYTCIDVDIDSIAHGEQEFPNATWIHWNKLHPWYNPTGFDESFPIADVQFDIIWSHSVFTHLDIKETLYCLEQLLKLKGLIIFSFVGTTNISLISKLISLGELTLSSDDNNSISTSAYSVVHDKSKLLLNTDDLSTTNYTQIWTFYSVDFLLNLISNLTTHYNRRAEHTIAKGWNWIIIK